MEELADFFGVTEHWYVTTLSELDEPVSGLPMANKQAPKVLPT